MFKNNIIISFSSDKICKNISYILNKNGINYIKICKTGSSLRKCCSYYENGIVLCSPNFVDEITFNIIEDFYEDFIFLLIGSVDKLNIYNNENIYKLYTPVKEEDIINAINISCYKNSEKIKAKHTKIIEEAKTLIMLNTHSTEPLAHKYIQKKSMETGKKNIEIAKYIISKYKK